MTTPNNTVAGLRDLIGQLVSMAAITDENTARSVAERIEAALASPAPSAGVGVEAEVRAILADARKRGYMVDTSIGFDTLERIIAALQHPAAPSVPDIDAMVNRFLGWRLPDDFGPDGGISFTPPKWPNTWPVGTNLLTAVQARAMFEHCMASAPSGVDLCEVARELERVHAEKVITDVAAIAGDRTDAYWSGHSQACEEIAHRLGLAPAALSGVSVPPSAPPSVAGGAGELPELPDSIASYRREYHSIFFHASGAWADIPDRTTGSLYTADQMRAYGEQCRRLVTAEQPGSAVQGDATDLIKRLRETAAAYDNSTADILYEAADALTARVSWPELYRPSNGTEGDSFRAAFCDRCTRDSAENPCPILGATMAYDVDDPEYPREWLRTNDGPTCTAFSPATQPEARGVEGMVLVSRSSIEEAANRAVILHNDRWLAAALTSMLAAAPSEQAGERENGK